MRIAGKLLLPCALKRYHKFGAMGGFVSRKAGAVRLRTSCLIRTRQTSKTLNLPAAQAVGYLSLIFTPPLMGGDQGEGDVSGVHQCHPHLTSPIKGEGSERRPSLYRELQVQGTFFRIPHVKSLSEVTGPLDSVQTGRRM